MSMQPKEFYNTYEKFARGTELKTGIHHLVILAQAALESGWGKAAPGNMFFGVKDTDGINGNEQLLTTTEYHSRNNIKYPVVLSVTPVVRNGRKMFKYKVRDYFRRYDTPENSFTEHAQFLLNNPRYRVALTFKAVPEKFAAEVAKAGYATDPDYSTKLISVIRKLAALQKQKLQEQK